MTKKSDFMDEGQLIERLLRRARSGTGSGDRNPIRRTPIGVLALALLAAGSIAASAQEAGTEELAAPFSPQANRALEQVRARVAGRRAAAETSGPVHGKSSRPAYFSRVRRLEAGFSPEEQALVDRHCLGGLPQKDPEMGPVATQYVVRDGYVLEHSSADRIPLWVAEYLPESQLSGSADRADSSFQPDPKLEKGVRAELPDYKGSGYDRGHQAPAGDFKNRQSLMDDSFFLSNMVPQNGPMNRGIWSKLEDRVRRWCRQGGEVHIITGPMFYDPREDSPDTADGLVEVETIGQNAVTVPTHLYKIVIAKRGTGGRKAIAIVLENTKPAHPTVRDEDVRTIDWIEERTGLDFMPNLPAEEQAALEGQADSPDDWD
ncbi:MAG: DNA/RNA non-specific endonuclease [Candidatus Wallbacteria bacterium]|nr:DNA/RNA non-specific endonuclease [Candidatus Wallbacteria bacterium]